ncbi:TIGR00730 family Rossman fold protein [Aquisalimonas sp.]|uniref:LOG family protein n=1 Tax=unclassified Aquisalimonas TaxID=2644645 RepID=UPI0025C0823D|nr:TIGR00730 family Rossman fold protein [Aquisalimonas sp.]
MKQVCVYCGSSPGRGQRYVETARAMGTTLARRGLGLVYGGASIGLMGEVAEATLAADGQVTGVIPTVVEEQEVAHTGLTELIQVDTMHERKTIMAERADAFIAMPGGLGTLEELFEILTWSQLRIHVKPVGLLNAHGYYDQLLAFLDHCVDEELIRPWHRNMLKVDTTPDALLERMMQS